MQKHATALAAVTAIVLVCSTASQAETQGLLTGPWADAATGFGQSFRIAQSDGPVNAYSQKEKKEIDQELPWYSKNRMHKYLGLGSMGLALATLAAPKEEDGAHEKLATAAAVLGGAAVANGIYAHWDDMEFTWDDPDTRHALLGALGTLGYILAVAKGGEGGHAAMGGLGAIAMGYAIKISW